MKTTPLGQYHGITERRIPRLGTNQLGSFPSVPDFTDFTSLSSAVRRNHQADARLVLWSAVGCQLCLVNKSSRQRTRSSTAHQFCTLARLRGLNGGPWR